MLDVDRRVDVDPRLEELLNILVALTMPTAVGVSMGQLVDQDELGMAGDGPV